MGNTSQSDSTDDGAESKGDDSSAAIPRKAVLISGCSSGIGEALTRKLRDLDFVVLASCRKQKDIDRWLSDASFTENGSTCFQLDIASQDSISAAKQQVATYLGEHNLILWALVNNAGVSTLYVPFEWMDDESIDHLIDVNLRGTIRVCKQFIPLLYGRCSGEPPQSAVSGGRCIIASSVMGEFGPVGAAVYGATKGALSQFAHSLRRELSPRFGIWTSDFQIGAFRTAMTDAQVMADKLKRYKESVENTEVGSAYRLEDEVAMAIKGQTEGLEEVFNDDFGPVIDDVVHCLTSDTPKRQYRSGWNMAMKMLVSLGKGYTKMDQLLFCADAEEAYSKAKQTGSTGQDKEQ